MGCDITSFIEVKKSDNPDKWLVVGKKLNGEFTEIPEIEFEGLEYSDFVENYDKGGLKLAFYEDRWYMLFAILADVRNKDKSRILRPISHAKGLPYDVSDYVLREAWSMDTGESIEAEEGFGRKYKLWEREINAGDGYSRVYHHHSWLTPDEIENYAGALSYEFFAPNSQFKYNENGEEEIVSWQEMNDSADYVRDFLMKRVRDFRKIEEVEDIVAVRTVFYFDN